MIEIELGKVIAGIIVFLVTNALAIYFTIWRKHIQYGIDIDAIKLQTNNLPYTRQRLIQQGKDIELIKEQFKDGEINKISRYLGKLEDKIKKLKENIQTTEVDYLNLRPLLESLMDKRSHFKDAERFLETISKHTKGIQIIDELGNFKQQLNIIEGIQKSQDLIKIGRYPISCDKNTFEQLKKGDGVRTADFTAEFGYEFDNKPEVFVAIAMIDADSRKNIRISVYVQSIHEDKFTFSVTTWYDSVVYGVDVAWIAIGKPKQ